MDMIAMLSGLGWTYPTKDAAKQPAAPVPAAVADEAARRIRAMDDVTLLTYAQAALNNQPYGNVSAERLAAVAPQIFAEVVVRFGPNKLAELAPAAPEAPSSGGGSSAAMGLLVVAIGAGAVWWYMRRQR